MLILKQYVSASRPLDPPSGAGGMLQLCLHVRPLHETLLTLIFTIQYS